MNAHADLSLRWAHSHFVGFCQEAARLLCGEGCAADERCYRMAVSEAAVAKQRICCVAVQRGGG